MHIEPKIGDRLVWSRAGNEDKVTILDILSFNGVKKAHLKVDGWASDGGWEVIDYRFITLEEWERRQALKKEMARK